MSKIKAIKTLDMTPTWEGVLPVYLMAWTDGNAKGRAAASSELLRMAQLADKWVAHCKANEGKKS